MKNFHKNVIPMHQIGFPIQANYIPHEDDSVRLLFKVTVRLDKIKEGLPVKYKNVIADADTKVKKIINIVLNE